MRRRVGIATSVVITCGSFGQGLTSPENSYLFLEDGSLYLWGVVIMALVTYWLGYGLVAAIQWILGAESRSHSLDSTAPAPTTSSSPRTVAQETSGQASSGSPSLGLAREASIDRSSQAGQTKPGSAPEQLESTEVLPMEDNWLEKLERLSALRHEGSLTEEEFTELKAQILPSRASSVEPSPSDQVSDSSDDLTVSQEEGRILSQDNAAPEPKAVTETSAPALEMEYKFGLNGWDSRRREALSHDLKMAGFAHRFGPNNELLVYGFYKKLIAMVISDFKRAEQGARGDSTLFKQWRCPAHDFVSCQRCVEILRKSRRSEVLGVWTCSAHNLEFCPRCYWSW